MVDTSRPTRYETAIPATLRRWIDAHPGIVRAISYEGGYASDTRNDRAYDVLLHPNLAVFGEHIIIEPTVSAVLAKLRSVEPCDCGTCNADN